MSSSYDVIIIGAGHNGLTAAGYLAKAGKSVLVLERKSYAGGGVSTRQLNTPGYWHDEHSSVHIMIQANPLLLNDELGLFSKFGLKYHYSEVPHATIFEDQSTLFTYKDLDKTCASIARVSERDAESYRRFALKSMSILPMITAGLYSPPFPTGPMTAMLDSSDEGREIFDAMQRSSVQLADELFESDKMKIHLVRLVSENLQMPDELGTGMGFFLMPGIIHTYGVSQPIGGSGKLSEALVRCVEHYGGEVRCDMEVEKVIVSGGRVSGVRMADGEEFHARDAVIGAIHPHKLRQFVSETPEPVLKRAERTVMAPFSICASHYDLKESIRYHAGEEVGKATMLEYMSTSRMSEMLDDFYAVARGRVPARRLLAGGDESINDKTRVPAGAGMFHSISFAPYEFEGRSASYWDEYKEQWADDNLNTYRKFISNLTDDNIIARTVWSPLDLERSSPNSMFRGDLHGVAPYFFQNGGHRPTPDLAQFAVPGVEGLYLTGPFMHPGGGVYGAGRATALRVFDDLNMDFDKLINAQGAGTLSSREVKKGGLLGWFSGGKAG
ncbi:MAG: NAD(P)/FAD-dependent oxidoreductase [Asticcacaulis sp.]